MSRVCSWQFITFLCFVDLVVMNLYNLSLYISGQSSHHKGLGLDSLENVSLFSLANSMEQEIIYHE